MINGLISKSTLEEKDDVISASVKAAPQHISDQAARKAHDYYALFGDEAALQQVGLSNLSAQDRFYNEYYWFLVLARLHQARNGPDAAFEDQSMKMLETAPPGVDWQRVEDIAGHAKQAA